MQASTKNLFLCLIIAQLLHSLEEYFFRLWEVFAPARVVSGMFSDNLTTGFVIANTLIVLFGFWCYFWPVRKAWDAARIFLWFWVLLALGNGIGHTILAIGQTGYFPGIFTAPLLLIFSGVLFGRLMATRNEGSVT